MDGNWDDDLFIRDQYAYSGTFVMVRKVYNLPAQDAHGGQESICGNQYEDGGLIITWDR